MLLPTSRLAISMAGVVAMMVLSFNDGFVIRSPTIRAPPPSSIHFNSIGVLAASSTSTQTSAPIKTNNETPKLQPTFAEKTLNNFQIWALCHPKNPIAQLTMPTISFVEGLLACEATYLDRKRLLFGNNFCVAGEVAIGDFATLESTITSPQARTYRLGTSPLDKDHLEVNGRRLFPLALSDPQIKSPKDLVVGDTHAQVMKVVNDLVINESAIQRQQDATAKRLLQEVAKDYATMDHAAGGEFFTSFERGLQRFLVRYQHYILFGLDPDDKESMDLLTKLYFESQGTAYFLSVLGRALQFFNVGGAKEWPAWWEQAKAIYKKSPVLSHMTESDKVGPLKITLDDLVTLLLPLLGIAALPGPLSLSRAALGGVAMPAYVGRKTDTIDMTKYWDAIPDLNDRRAVENHIYEAGRLWMPVSATHRVAGSEFTVQMSEERTVTFPAGTVISVPMILAMLDETFWGPTAYDYDASRPNLCPFSMLFNSVGERSNGRMCPGKTLAMNLVVQLLQTLGSVRRAGGAVSSSTA